MKLFLDTEFTDLVPHNKLISIAMVSDTGNYFYAELTDTYELKDCSEFVINNILPLLRGGEYRMTHYECSLRLGNWIEEQGPNCLVALDNPSWDMPHLRRLLDPIWPENLHKNQYFPVYLAPPIVDDIILKNNFRIHNALDDAMIMMLAMKQLGR